MNFIYTIDEQNVVEVYSLNYPTVTGAPFLRQESWPDGSSWDKDQATAWVEAFIAHLEDPTNPVAGPNAEHPTVELVDVAPEVPAEPAP